MQLSDLIAAIEGIAPLWAQSSWDMSGLQVASSREFIERMAVCLDPTPERIEEALAGNADFILAHHPLSLKPELPNRLNSYTKVLSMLFCGNVSLYSAHTSLDVNPEGPAGWLARDLSLANTNILEPVAGTAGAAPLGFGLVGDLPTSMRWEDLADKVLDLLHLDNAAICGPKPNGMIRRIAYCGGSGSSLVNAAKKSGAELFITGDMKYHSALESCLPVLDVGHHSIEEEMMRRMAALLNARVDIDVIFMPSRDVFTHIGRVG